MSYRTLDAVGGIGGGPMQLLQDPKRARNIHVSVANNTAATVAAFLARSRRELSIAPVFGQAGFPIVGVPNTVANQTVAGIAYTTFILQGWTGELWAVGSVAGVLIDVYEAGGSEK
jgi:hypothetical protein